MVGQMKMIFSGPTLENAAYPFVVPSFYNTIPKLSHLQTTSAITLSTSPPVDLFKKENCRWAKCHCLSEFAVVMKDIVIAHKSQMR